MSSVTHNENTGNKYLIRGIGLTKVYGNVKALVDCDVELDAGEVLALVGDNGAGKTTLIKILSGVIQPDQGQIEVKGQNVRIPTPRHAGLLGIATVFQDMALVDSRDVISNVFLGHELTKNKFFIDRAKMAEQSKAVLSQLRIDIPSLTEEVGVMSGGQRGAIAVGRAISRNCHTVIMDEPTAALGVKQSRQVLDLVRQLREQGTGVMIVAHNLHHVLSIADRIMVLRHGRTIGIRTKDQTSVDEIEQMIIGAEAS